MNGRPILLVAAGAVLGISFVLSCGNSPTTADAADACNCPAAEPPLAGRIVSVDTHLVLPAQSVSPGVAQCAPGAILLGGSCGQDTNTVAEKDLVLLEAKADGLVWQCSWSNGTAVERPVIISARCLNPAQ